MKRSHLKLFSLFTLLALAAASLTIASAAPLSPALDNIAHESRMVKTGFMYNSISFTRSDFDLACGTECRAITITKLPPSDEGKLILGDSTVRENQSISAKNLSKLKYVPNGGIEESSFTFTTDNSYSIECQLRLIADNNSSPTAGGAENVSVSTIENISIFGNLSGNDPDGDAIIFEISDYPEKGLLVLLDKSSGYFKYTPYSGSSGQDCFSYRVRDEYGNYSDTAAMTVTITKQKSKLVFSDMDEHWAHNAAIAAVERGLMKAESIGNSVCFNPELSVSRVDFLVMAMNCLGADKLPTVASTVFADDDQLSDADRPYVFAAYHLGIISGSETDGKLCFNPNTPITKAEAAVILNNIIRASASDITPVWSDDESIPAWAKSSLYALNELGIFKRSESGAICSQNELTRADCADILFTLTSLFDV